jgi:transposase
MTDWHKLSDEEKLEKTRMIKEEFAAGLTIPEIANKLDIVRNIVHHVLKDDIINMAEKINRRPGIKIYNTSKGRTLIITDDEIKNICKDYLKGESLINLANKYKINHNKISEIIKKNGIEIRKSPETSINDILSIIEEYKNGKSTIQISKEKKMNLATVCNILKRNNVKMRGAKHNFTEEEIKLIIDEYCKGVSSIKIAKRYGVCSETILKLLKKYNVKIRNNQT